MEIELRWNREENGKFLVNFQENPDSRESLDLGGFWHCRKQQPTFFYALEGNHASLIQSASICNRIGWLALILVMWGFPGRTEEYSGDDKSYKYCG